MSTATLLQQNGNALKAIPITGLQPKPFAWNGDLSGSNFACFLPRTNAQTPVLQACFHSHRNAARIAFAARMPPDHPDAQQDKDNCRTPRGTEDIMTLAGIRRAISRWSICLGSIGGQKSKPFAAFWEWNALNGVFGRRASWF